MKFFKGRRKRLTFGGFSLIIHIIYKLKSNDKDGQAAVPLPERELRRLQDFPNGASAFTLELSSGNIASHGVWGNVLPRVRRGRMRQVARLVKIGGTALHAPYGKIALPGRVFFVNIPQGD